MSILDENIAQNTNAEGGLAVTSEMKRNWMTTSKWAMFFAILGFIYIGISALALGSMGAVLRMIMAMQGDNPVFAALGPLMSYVTILTGAMLVVFFFVYFYHFRFANQIQRAVNFTDQIAFEKAWLNLRNHFRLYGIIVCVMLAFYAILLIVVGTAVAGAAGGNNY